MLARVRAVHAGSARRWGRMSVSDMLAHVADQLRIALGEIEAQGVPGPLRFPPLRYLAIHVVPWPKGRVQAPPEAFTTAPTEIEADRAALVALIERFARAPDAALAAPHPLFGHMSARDWDVLSYRHLDHHLRQFGA
jgi:hypothetical protein